MLVVIGCCNVAKARLLELQYIENAGMIRLEVTADNIEGTTKQIEGIRF